MVLDKPSERLAVSRHQVLLISEGQQVRFSFGELVLKSRDAADSGHIYRKEQIRPGEYFVTKGDESRQRYSV